MRSTSARRRSTEESDASLGSGTSAAPVPRRAASSAERWRRRRRRRGEIARAHAAASDGISAPPDRGHRQAGARAGLLDSAAVSRCILTVPWIGCYFPDPWGGCDARAGKQVRMCRMRHQVLRLGQSCRGVSEVRTAPRRDAEVTEREGAARRGCPKSKTTRPRSSSRGRGASRKSPKRSKKSVVDAADDE